MLCVCSIADRAGQRTTSRIPAKDWPCAHVAHRLLPGEPISDSVMRALPQRIYGTREPRPRGARSPAPAGRSPISAEHIVRRCRLQPSNGGRVFLPVSKAPQKRGRTSEHYQEDTISRATVSGAGRQRAATR